MTVDQLNVVIRAETAGLRRDLNNVQAQFQGVQKQVSDTSGRITGSLKKIGVAVAAAFSVRALVNFGKQAVELASDLQEVENVVSTSFGNMTQEVNAWAKTTVDRFGMSELSAKQTASTYMAMSKGMGLMGKQAAEMAMQAAERTGDIASFYNTTQQQADTMLKSIWTGETESLKQIGVVMTQTNLDAYALAKGFGKTTDAMTQAEQVQLRFQYVMEQTNLAAGDFQKTSGSWANQTRVLSERFKELLATLGSGLIQVLTPILQVLNSIVQKLIEAAQAVNQFIGAMFGTSGVVESTQQAAAGAGAIAVGLESATDAAKELKKATAGFDEMTILSAGQAVSSGGGPASGGLNLPAASVGDFKEPDTSGVSRAAEKVKDIFENLKTYITTSFAPTITSWGNAFSGLKEPVSNALSNIKTSFTTLWNETLLPFGGYLMGEFIPNVTNAFSETFAPIFGQVMPVLFEEFSKDFDFACGEISRITADILQPAFTQTEIIAVGVFDGIKKAWDKYGKGILEGFQTFRDSLKSIWDQVYTKIIKPVVDNIGGKLSELWDNHLKPLWDNITNFLGSLAEFLLTIWNEVLSPLVGYIIDWVAPKIQQVIENIWSVISTVWGMISDVIGGIMKALSGLMDFITGVFKGDWEKAWNGIKDFFVGIWDAIWGVVKGAINLIVDGLNMLWSGVYSVVSGIVNGIGGIAEVIGDLFGQDWEFDMPEKPPKIPKLATGGIVDRATTAVIGEAGREAVLPLENNTGWMDTLAEKVASLVKAGKPSKLILKVGEAVFGEVSLNSLNAYARQHGGLDLVMEA